MIQDKVQTVARIEEKVYVPPPVFKEVPQGTYEGVFHLIVPIKQEFRHGQPFKSKLESNIVNAIIFSYAGTRK